MKKSKCTPKTETNLRAVLFSIVCALVLIATSYLSRDSEHSSYIFMITLPLVTTVCLASFRRKKSTQEEEQIS